jgi:predicted ribosomally synthesized peptide with SipW-like signal peptide
MTKKILISLTVIGVVAAIAVGGTIAYFSDTETSVGNTFSTGVIDITIKPEGKWLGGWHIEDMKPCETGYIIFNIHNPGKNPVNIWKTIKNITTDDGDINEPECVYDNGIYHGVWDPVSKACDVYNENPRWQYEPKSNLHDWMNYDLSVKVTCPDDRCGDPINSGWWQLIYKDEDNKRVGQINGIPIFLGMIPSEGSMEVTQSYHLIPDTGNWAQADTMTFDIEIYAKQLTGELVLENKSGDPDWQILRGDGIKADLTYNLTGPTFDYSLKGKVALNTEYSLIYYADPWPGNGGNTGGKLIDTVTPDVSNNIDETGSIDLGMDLPSSPDNNFPSGAKIWLVPSSSYDTDTKSIKVWDWQNFLFDTALMTYDDTGI